MGVGPAPPGRGHHPPCVGDSRARGVQGARERRRQHGSTVGPLRGLRRRRRLGGAVAWAKRLFRTVRRAAANARLAVLLLMCIGLIVNGVRGWSVSAAYVTAGALLAVWAVLFLLDVPENSEGGP